MHRGMKTKSGSERESARTSFVFGIYLEFTQLPCISIAKAVIPGASSQKVGCRSAASTSDGTISPRETGRAERERSQ